MPKKIMNFVLYTITYIVTLILLVGIDVWSFKLAWDDLSIEFVLNKSLIAALFTIISIITTLMVYDLLELKDKRYTSLEETLEKEAIKLMGSHFNESIARLDWNTKKIAWRKYIDVKLFNFRARASRKVRQELMTLDPKDYSRKTLKFIDKENMYQEFLTSKWINENLYFQKINYATIEPNEVLYGTRKNTEKKSRLVRNPLTKSLGFKLAMFFPSLIATIIVSILQEDDGLSMSGLSILISGLILTLLINTLVGIKNGYKSHSFRLSNTRERYSIVVAYKEGEYDKLDPVPKRKYERDKEEIEENKREQQPIEEDKTETIEITHEVEVIEENNNEKNN